MPSSPPPDAINFEDAAPSDDELSSVAALAARQRQLETEISAVTATLREKLRVYRDLTENEIPEAMAATGLTSIETSSGNRLSLDTRYIGSQLSSEPGLKYLIENNLGDVIKTQITLEIAQEDFRYTRELVEYIRNHPIANRFLNMEVKRTVHPMTLASLAKNLVEARKDPPLDILGVYKRVRSRLSGRRLKTTKIDSAFVIDDGGDPTIPSDRC